MAVCSIPRAESEIDRDGGADMDGALSDGELDADGEHSGDATQNDAQTAADANPDPTADTGVDACVPRAATDSTCDGIDDDCSGSADEEYVSPALQCGTGYCRSTSTEQAAWPASCRLAGPARRARATTAHPTASTTTATAKSTKTRARPAPTPYDPTAALPTGAALGGDSTRDCDPGGEGYASVTYTR